MIMITAELETLLEEWRDGKYIEVSEVVKTLPPQQIVTFCELMVKYSGQNNLSVLVKFMD